MAVHRSKPPIADDLTREVAPLRQVPQLGIIHFLAWLTITAALIGTYESVRRAVIDARPPRGADTWLPPESKRGLGDALVCANLAIVAAGMVAAWAAMRARTAVGFDAAAGHWLAAVNSVANVGSAALLGAVFPDTLWLVGAWPAGAILLLCAGPWIVPFFAGVWLFLAFRFRDEFVWALCFGIATLACATISILAVTTIWIAELHLPDWLDPPIGLLIGPSATGGLVLIASLTDIAQGNRRDWAHWVGITLTVLQPVLCWAALRLV